MNRTSVKSSDCHSATSIFFRATATSVVVFIFATWASAAPPSPSSSFSGLGFLPGGGALSNASAISADGSVVVGGALSAFGSEAFRWTSAVGMVGLGDLPGGQRWSFAYGVSANGSVVTGASRTMVNPGGAFPIADQGFRWTASGGMVALGTLAGGTGSLAYGTSADGSVIAGNGFEYTLFPSGVSSRHDVAARWTSAGGLVDLAGLGGNDGISYGVSADGAVVVGQRSTAFRWTNAGGMQDLGTLPGPSAIRSVAYATSADGSVAVGMSGVSSHGTKAFRWTSAGGMVDLGNLGGTSSSGDCSALAVSADGERVVGFSDSPTGRVAFLWTGADGMVSLKDYLIAHGASNLTGWTLTAAQGISGNGNTIVGYGRNPAGQSEAWIATVPEPSSVVLALIALLTFASMARRRWR